MTQETLHDLFSQAGRVEEVRLPIDRATGQARGFAFVEMASSRDAQDAVKMFDGYMLEGRRLRVNLAEERAPRPARYGRGGGDEAF